MGIASKLNKTVLIYRNTIGAGYHPTNTWALLSTVAGLLTQMSSNEIIDQDGKKIIIDAKLYILPTDVTQLDRIKIDSDYYDIYRIKNPQSKTKHYEISMSRLQDGTM